MRNRIKKEVILSKEEQINALSVKLDTALQEIKALKDVVALKTIPDTTPWKFDVERDTHGKIRGVIAQKENNSNRMN